MVEVESFSSENSFPLRGRDSTWGTPVDFDQEFGTGDVVVVGLEKFTGFVTAGVARVRGFVGVIPTHVGFLCLNALPRGLAVAIGLFRGLVSCWPSSERNFVEQVVDGSVDFLLFSGRKDVVSEFFVESDGIELLDVEVDRVFLFKLRKGVVAVDKGADVTVKTALDLGSRLSLYPETKDESLVRKAWRSCSLAGSTSPEDSASPAAGSDDPRICESECLGGLGGCSSTSNPSVII